VPAWATGRRVRWYLLTYVSQGDDSFKGHSSCRLLPAMSNTTAGWAAAAGADSRGHCVPRLAARQASENPVLGHSLPSNEISNEIRWSLVFVTTRCSDVFVTSLSNRYYSRTSIMEV